MAAYQMEGTPTLVLMDRQGHRRAQHFGHVPDLRLGAEIKALVDESAEMPIESASTRVDNSEEYRDLKALRLSAVKSSVVFIDGILRN